jgi:hypothetical protein
MDSPFQHFWLNDWSHHTSECVYSYAQRYQILLCWLPFALRLQGCRRRRLSSKQSYCKSQQPRFRGADCWRQQSRSSPPSCGQPRRSRQVDLVLRPVVDVCHHYSFLPRYAREFVFLFRCITTLPPKPQRTPRVLPDEILHIQDSQFFNLSRYR